LFVEQELNATTPEEYRKDAHHWLLLHGRYVCVARIPLCPKCLISDLCEYPNKTPAKAETVKAARRVGPLADAEAKAARRKRSGGGEAQPVRKVAATVRARAAATARKVLLKSRAR
jgi:hypothetical protein